MDFPFRWHLRLELAQEDLNRVLLLSQSRKRNAACSRGEEKRFHGFPRACLEPVRCRQARRTLAPRSIHYWELCLPTAGAHEPIAWPAHDAAALMLRCHASEAVGMRLGC